MQVVERSRTVYIFDLIRGIAAIAVASFHLNTLIEPLWMAHGYLAVDLFFMMSGCVIELAYANRIRKGMTAKDFFIVRFVRLYPLYALGTAISAGLVIIGLATGKSANWTVLGFAISLAAAAIFMPFAGRSSDSVAFPLNQPAYSLFYEILVNIGYVLFFRKLTDRVLKVLIAISAVLIVVVALAHGTIDLGYKIDEIVPGFPRATFGFFLGVYIARRCGTKQVTSGNWQCGLMLLLIGVSFIGQGFHPMDPRIWDLFFILIGYPIVVWLAFSFDLGERFHGAASILGKSSYAVYAIHLPVFAFAANIAQIVRVDRAALAPYWGLGLIVLVFLMSLLVDRWFDIPARQRLKDWLGMNRSSRKVPDTAAI